MQLSNHKSLFLKQRRELAELIGFETRNKYEVFDEAKNLVGFAAEQQKGILGLLLRQLLGHWRSFDILFFEPNQKLALRAHHPFRFFFQRLEVFDASGLLLGAIQQRFAIFTKKFDVLNPDGLLLFSVSSPFWKIWTFPFRRNQKQVAVVTKKWTGILSEGFTDKDSFRIEYSEPSLSENERRLVLAAGVFVDLQYFERKAS